MCWWSKSHSEKQCFLFKSSCRVSALPDREIVLHCKGGSAVRFSKLWKENSSFQKGDDFPITWVNIEAQLYTFLSMKKIKQNKNIKIHRVFIPWAKGHYYSHVSCYQSYYSNNKKFLFQKCHFYLSKLFTPIHKEQRSKEPNGFHPFPHVSTQRFSSYAAFVLSSANSSSSHLKFSPPLINPLPSNFFTNVDNFTLSSLSDSYFF